MAVTAWTFPQTVLNDDTGTPAWANPTYVKADDAAYASVTPGSEYSDTILTYAYGFSLPANVIVDGIEVAVHKARSGGSGIYDLSVRLRAAGAGYTGNDQAGEDDWDTAGEVVHGGPTDLWGLALTKAIVEETGFGVGVSCYGNNAGEEARVEYIAMRIYYHDPVAPTVTTQAATNVDWDSATGNGNITDVGDVSITQHGVC
ncbi:MAG: hypothetical protein KKC50_08100, partial [Candidatus Omnitrophica bacterium]|nr:hypothetical protein [Candidatus Omnitrophota bacterium]